MKSKKRKRVKVWSRDNIEDFLNLSPEEIANMDVKSKALAENILYKNPKGRPFVVTRNGVKEIMGWPPDKYFGYFITSFENADNMHQIMKIVDAGILFKDIVPVVKYLDLKNPDIAKAASVSPSTVSRWKNNSAIGVPASNQFFMIDELIKKGVTVFKGEKEFKSWLSDFNIALGIVPMQLITSHIGIGFVDGALEALKYGTVI